jgi:hypothetical protein
MGRGNRIAPRFADEKVEEGRLAYSDIVAPHAQPGKVVTQSFDFPIETLLLRRALLLDIDQIRFDVMESKRGTGSFRVGMPRPRMRSRRGMLLEPKIASLSTSTSSRSDETRRCIKSHLRERCGTSARPKACTGCGSACWNTFPTRTALAVAHASTTNASHRGARL